MSPVASRSPADAPSCISRPAGPGPTSCCLRSPSSKRSASPPAKRLPAEHHTGRPARRTTPRPTMPASTAQVPLITPRNRTAPPTPPQARPARRQLPLLVCRGRSLPTTARSRLTSSCRSAGCDSTARTCSPTGPVSSRRHIEPCTRFSRTGSLTFFTVGGWLYPRQARSGSGRQDGCSEADQAQPTQ